mmetsp:Transcript_24343/g.41663  ORF Transcript_24343/g.41663 Transcript_24343/m.41663 type:complete len:439 (+) Transcript_24343:14-1330(+)|eukprot:CAMPEP_0183785074 /NCGR_PEP_ID=MMETSP0739-20130205/66318_1 /TAXON_ID=385413 /ORGANISM="Thalassiosira miniscula, Strain CCMP1093" /LENGTH=438 /DNA_ID=CAMNT_0026029069 /DNA_START=11 /DNA_END=1327 /DNA_ORIENTATION=+
MNEPHGNEQRKGTLTTTMSKVKSADGDDAEADAPGNTEMKGLVAAAAMMAKGGDESKEDASAKKQNSIQSSNNIDETIADEIVASSSPMASNKTSSKGGKKPKDITAARARRLEQNRRAAIESRRRKKVMIGELQRSVAFYSKANENLRLDNCDLERRLFLAKRRVMEIEAGMEIEIDATDTANAELKAPPEDASKLLTSPKEESSIPVVEKPSQNMNEQRHQQNVVLSDLTSSVVQSLHTAVSPMQTAVDHSQAHLAATQAMYEARGYSSSAARVAANTFSPFVGVTDKTPGMKADIATNFNATDRGGNFQMLPPTAAHILPPSIAAQLPSEKEVGSDKYMEALKKFAIQQTAAANASATAANVAIQALHFHNMMKEATNNGANKSPPMIIPPFVPSISMPPTILPSIAATRMRYAATVNPASGSDKEPPKKKPKSK